ncbi:Outer membrane protein beta-barrel domain-containing protein [Robiginitalea myxolifaciens]|uniref:Outer membrane protein beta-barrel domain-containing protein n=1 Tax=Robiginitalea myxolifaciens TaxID=400055 RepID=A0A1I6G1Y5_9FLAO|nr:outer membrane beta-barrel protein [Robiginitalea myxolifaciens]SFR36077.1 Outer membrane protein beta-barrel domain-containing protein [Robiginitalea myxolifaciens]
MKKKYTDDIFRDKLKDYQENPDPAVWDRIEHSLNRRKRRGVIPIWWTLGGVAALLALGIFLFGPEGVDTMPSGVSDSPSVVKDSENQEASEATTGEQTSTQEQLNSREQTQEEGVARSGRGDTPNQEEADAGERVANNPVTREAQRDRTTGTEVQQEGTAQPERQAVAAVENRSGEDNQESRLEKIVSGENSQESAVAVTEAVVADPQGEVSIMPDPQESNRSGEQTNTTVLPNRNTTDTGVAVAEEKDPEEGKISILDAAAEQEALSRNEDEFQNAEEKSKSWTVGPAVAPVFYSNFGNGSPLDQDFVPNSKSGTLNMSFGVAVAYAVTGKLSVRSGVHRVDFGYNTNQVSFSPSLNAGPSSLIRTISYSESSRNVVVHSNVSGAGAQAVENALDVSAQSPQRNGSMLQEFGYLEIPLEMQYALVEGKFGVNLIGGMSSLFLVNNSVSLDSSGSRTEIGEANNINPVNFSSNLGLGLYYNLNPSMQLNLQPMFKYHMNAFSQTAGDFQPYTLGVYSGLSFRF